LFAEHRATVATTSDFADTVEIEGAPAVGVSIEAPWQALDAGLEYGVNDAPKTLRWGCSRKVSTPHSRALPEEPEVLSEKRAR
jgi:hypothetical protein